MKPENTRQKIKEQNERLMPMRYQYALTLKEQGMKNSEIAKILRCNVYTVTKMIKAAREANTGMVPSYPHSKRDEHARSLVKKIQALPAAKKAIKASESNRPAEDQPPMSHKADSNFCPCCSDGPLEFSKRDEANRGLFSRLIDSWTRFWSS